MTQYNQTDEVKRNPHLYRQLQFYRFRGSPDEGSVGPQQKSKDDEGEYENLFACAHLYASDKNSLFIIPYALGRPDNWTTLVSLSLTVIFHQHGNQLRMIDRDSGERKWFLEEFRTSRSGENRALHETRLWTADGILLATAVQDGLVRFKEADGPKL
jgi:acyl-CoA thioesterase